MNDETTYEFIENLGKINLNLYVKIFDKKILT